MNTKNPYSQHQLYYQPFSKRLCFGTRFQIGSMMFSVMFRNCRNSFFFSFLPQYRYNFIVQLLCVVQLLRRTLHSAVELTTSFVSLVLPCVDDALAQTPGGKTIYWLPLDQFRYLTLYFSPNPQPKNVFGGISLYCDDSCCYVLHCCRLHSQAPGTNGRHPLSGGQLAR